MVATIDKRRESGQKVDTVVQDLFHSPNISRAINEILGKTGKDIEGKNLHEKLEILAKNGFISGNRLKELLMLLRGNTLLQDFKGNENKVLAFILALKQIETEFNPGLLKKTGHVVRDIARRLDLPSMEIKDIESTEFQNIKRILSSAIEDILGQNPQMTKIMSEVLGYGFSPVNEKGETINIKTIDIVSLGLNGQEDSYLRVETNGTGKHYISKTGEILHIKIGFGKKMVTKISKENIQIPGFFGSSTECCQVFRISSGKRYFLKKGKFHAIKEKEFVNSDDGLLWSEENK